MIDAIPMQYETGQVTFQQSDGWVSVTFKNKYTYPIVIASPITTNDTTPFAIGLKNVKPEGFEIKMFETSGESGDHSSEIIGFFVIEGVYGGSGTLPSGERFECGVKFIYDTGGSGFSSESFDTSFDSSPIIFSTIAHLDGYYSGYEPDRYLTTRIQNISTSSFELAYQGEEGGSTGSTMLATWLAIEPITDPNFKIANVSNVQGVDDGWSSVSFSKTFSQAPNVLSQIQTYVEADPCRAAVKNIATTGCDIVCYEDTENDSETGHGAETVAYFAIEPSLVYSPTVIEKPQGYGFRVSLSGYDVMDSNLDPENLVYSTEFSGPKILTEGTGELTISDGNNESSTWTLNHNYGVPLAYLIYFRAHVDAIDEDAYFLSPINLDMGMQALPTTPPTDSGYYTEDVSDKDNIKFKARRETTSGDVTIPFKYYVLLEPLEEFNGQLPTIGGDYGFKISKPGKSVFTGKEHDMAFSSSHKFFKLKDIVREQVGVPKLESSGSDVRLAFRHDLGYFPAFWAYSSHPNLTGIYDTPVSNAQAGATTSQAATALVEAYTTKTHFYFRIIRQAGYGTSMMGGPYIIDWAKKLYDFIYVVTYEKLGS